MNKTLNEVMKFRNADDKVYISDLCEWIGVKTWNSLNSYEKKELQEKITMVSNVKG